MTQGTWWCCCCCCWDSGTWCWGMFSGCLPALPVAPIVPSEKIWKSRCVAGRTYNNHGMLYLSYRSAWGYNRPKSRRIYRLSSAYGLQAINRKGDIQNIQHFRGRTMTDGSQGSTRGYLESLYCVYQIENLANKKNHEHLNYCLNESLCLDKKLMYHVQSAQSRHVKS